MNWHEYVKKTQKIPAWPYNVNYGKENVVKTDVLVIGGGVAGIRAAISARQHGATVAIADRGSAKHSGAGGAGVDHWHGAVLNPCSKVTPTQYSEIAMECATGFTNGLARYVIGKEGWDTVQELEKWGVQIRDVNDDFKGTMFRDEETKLCFAYDVEAKHCLRIWGNNIKPAIATEAKRIGCEIYERICIFALLTEDGKQGARICGALGVHDRTGEFFIFKCKAAVIATGNGMRLWGFAPEVINCNAMRDMNQTSLGHTIGWKAGANLALMEIVNGGGGSGFGYAPYSMGNSDNTYQGAPMVDADGKQIPFANSYGELISDYRQVFQSAHNENFVIGHGIGLTMNNRNFSRDYSITSLDPSIGKKTRVGDYKLPFYTDMTILEEKDRDILYRLMLAHEGKCRVPIFENWNNAGFDPAKDMIQTKIMNPDGYPMISTWVGLGDSPPNWRSASGGGFITDWRLQTSLPGLFVAGGAPLYGGGCHGEAHTTGRYSGRQAAAFARGNSFIEPNPEQIRKEKDEVYAHVNHPDGDVGWKELNYAIARVMQDYLGDYKNEDTLNMGLRRLIDMRESEGERTFVNNPHELARMVEDYSLFSLGQCYIEAAKARKASTKLIGFQRLDYPEDDPEWNKLVAIRLINDASESSRVPCEYHRMAPYAYDLEENYQKYAELD